MLGSAKPGALVDGYDRRSCIRTWESNIRKVLAGGKKLLSPGDADDRSPSRIRGMFQVMWLMARATSWQSSTDFGMSASFKSGRAASLGDGSPWGVRFEFDVLMDDF